MFVFLDDTEFLDLKEELQAIGRPEEIDVDEVDALKPYRRLWLEDNGIDSVFFEGDTIVSQKHQEKLVRILSWCDAGRVLDDSDVASVHLVHRLHNYIRDYMNRGEDRCLK